MNVKGEKKSWRLILSIVLSAALAAATASGRTAALQEGSASGVERLDPASSIERTIHPAETHRFSLELAAGQYARAELEQLTTHLELRVVDPDGSYLHEAHSLNSNPGVKTLSWIAQAPRRLILEVACPEDSSKAALYRLSLSELREAQPDDRLWIEAEAAETAAFRHYSQRSAEARRKSLASSQKALANWRKLDNRTRQARSLQSIGMTQRVLSLKPEALESLNLAFQMWRDLKDPRGEALALNQLGLLHRSMSQFDRSLECYAQALEVWRSLDDARGQATVLNNMARIQLTTGKPHQARESLSQALEIFQRLKDARRQAVALINLGVIADGLGEPLEAFNCYEQALSLAKERQYVQMEAQISNNLARLYDRLDEKQDALSHYANALGAFRRLGNRRWQAVTLSNLSNLYSNLGQGENALDYSRQALETYREIGDLEGQSKALNNLGRAHMSLGQSDEALASYQQAMDIQTKTEDRLGLADSLSNMGGLYNRVGRTHDAVASLERSLQLNQQTGARYEEARDRRLLGQILAASGKSDEALGHFRRSLELSRELQAPNQEAATLRELARAEMSKGDLDAAKSFIEPALEIVESLRIELAESRLRSTYFGSLQRVYELYIDLLMRLDQERPGQGHQEKAFEAAERMRARSLIDVLRQARAGTGSLSDPRIWDQLRSLRLQINDKAARRTNLLGKPDKVEQLARVQGELDELLKRYDLAQVRLRAESPLYASLEKGGTVSLKRLQEELLDEDTVLLEYSLGEDRSILWTVGRNTLRSFELPSRIRIEGAAQKAHGLLSSLAPRRRLPQLQRSLDSLSEMLLRPAQSVLKGKKRLLIVADGALQYIPFAVLPSPSQGGPSGASKAPLVVDYELVSLPSASVLDELRRRERKADAAQGQVAVLADPVYQVDDPRLQPLQAGPASQAARSNMAESARLHANTQLSRLPWGRKEAEAIAEQAGNDEVFLALDFDANRASVEKANGYRIVHFAVHGLLDSRHPELSGLALSLVDESGRPQDGFLRLHDIYDLELHAELVVLSGCRTALGKEVRGEGLLSLTRGFLYVGASQVMASLWPVRDEAAAELARRFYGELFSGDLPPAEALRQAQISMWKESRWSNPYFWGPFVIQGDWLTAKGRPSIGN